MHTAQEQILFGFVANVAAQKKKRRRRTEYQRKCLRSRADLLRQIWNLSRLTGWTFCRRDSLREELRGPASDQFRRAPCDKTLRNYLDYLECEGRIELDRGRRGYVCARLTERGERAFRTRERVVRWFRAVANRRLIPMPQAQAPQIKRKQSNLKPTLSKMNRTVSGTISMSPKYTSLPQITSLEGADEKQILEFLARRVSPGGLAEIKAALVRRGGRVYYLPGKLCGHRALLLERVGLKPIPDQSEAV